MTLEHLTALFSADLNLSAHARALVAHVASVDGEEIAYSRLLRLLQVKDEKKLRVVIAEAEDAGWIEVNRQTGKGHNPEFRFTPPKNGTLNFTLPNFGTVSSDTLPKNGTLNAPHVRASSPTTTTTPPSPTTTAGEGEREWSKPTDLDLARLRNHLGDHSQAVDMMMEAAEHPVSWVNAVMGKYGPSGTQPLTGVPPDRRPAVLASALIDYATTRKPFENKYFDGFIRKAADNERKGNQPREAGSHAPSPARAATGTDGVYRDTRGRVWLRE